MGAAAVGLAAGPAQGPGAILVRGGRVVNADGSRVADVRVVGDVIAEIGPELTAGSSATIIDAAGKLVIPGGIDPHTHLQGSFVDDLTTGTAAAVAGGITTVGTFAYPREGENPIEAMERWLGEVSSSAIGDVFFHGSMWPPSAESASMMRELAALGQPSHKVFMTRQDFGAHLSAFIELLEAARDAGVVTLMHCEDAAMLQATLRRLRAEGRTSLRHYAESRPEIAEVAATAQAVALCELTRAPMHLVHLSSRRALDAARNPETAGLPLSIETRPLYLYFTEQWLAGEDGPLYAPWTRAQKMDPELDVGHLRPGVSDLRFMLPVLFSDGVRKDGFQRSGSSRSRRVQRRRLSAFTRSAVSYAEAPLPTS